MAERGDILRITLKMGTRQFQMNVRRADEYLYREAEKLINKRYRFYADKFQNQENEVYLMMTMLDVAVSLKRLEASADNTPMLSVIESLVADMEREIE